MREILEFVIHMFDENQEFLLYWFPQFLVYVNYLIRKVR